VVRGQHPCQAERAVADVISGSCRSGIPRLTLRAAAIFRGGRQVV